MVLHLSESRSSLVAVALVGLIGCGAEAGTTVPGTDVASGSTDVGSEIAPQAIGVVTGHFKDGHVTFDAMEPVAGTGDLSPQGFGKFTQNKVSFSTAAGDGVGVSGITGGCTATQYCAMVTLTNNTGRAMESVYSEITDYFNKAPANAPVTWAGSAFTRSDAYKGLFLHGTSGVLEVASFGNIPSGGSSTVAFKFEVGTATNFDFHVAEYASFPRSFISGSGVNGAATGNACATPGNTLVTDSDDQEVAVNLPFAFTLVDRTYDRAVIGSNGYILFFPTGGAQPSLGAGQSNNTAIAAGYAVPGIYPFWDDLAYDSGIGAVCTQVSGTKPNRAYTVSWSNAKIANNRPTIPKTFGADRIVYSLVLTETTDNFRMLYTLPTTGITPASRGATATIMFNYFRNGSLEHQVYGYNGVSQPPASAANYPYAFNGAQYQPNP